MKRREFLAASCVAGLAPLAELGGAAETATGDKELLELRLYAVKSAAQRKRLDEFLAKAGLPAFNRIGVSPVGVFQFADGKTPDLYVLLPHKTAASAVGFAARLLADETFVKDAAAWLDLPKSDPLYDRIESTLLLGFDQAPKVEVPDRKAGRIFQLRIYESHSLKKGRKKIEMFNAGGEIALFRRVGMKPVFFGEALFGARMPNLTYMLSFEDKDAQKAAWAKFLGSPEWKKMSGDPQYKDTVSRITNIELTPTEYSQV